ncbi:hypothetical protein K438DRAFT_1967366 [Mycena galopus ATCC 62051]|nr:hypothetical protein K438DRAFT_1967366 [Mycena galopus ATCC 62051]
MLSAYPDNQDTIDNLVVNDDHITHHVQRIFAHIGLPCIENILVLLITSIPIVMPIVLSVTLAFGA